MPLLTATLAAKIKTELVAGRKQTDVAADFGVSRSLISDIATDRAWAAVPWPKAKPKPSKKALTEDLLLTLLRRRRHTVTELAAATDGSERAVLNKLSAMQSRGVLVYDYGTHWGLEKQPAAGGTEHIYRSDRNGCYTFGFCGDTHLCSKYERLDVINDLYDKFAAAKVDRVFHTGNWIDGEARFNMHDLHTHGMDAQIGYMAEHYPQRDGIYTYAVAGDDHEGWYGQRDGIDIGMHAARIMRERGRRDWRHLGYMESFVTLQHSQSGGENRLLVMHPGGGSAYAHSYKPQKIVESFAGGEKPAVLLIGHYHKISQNVIRNVWAIQTGCAQDQTPFMRKRGIDAHVGGGVCWLTQDERGAIVSCKVQFFLYYNRGYYNGRWSHGGPVVLPQRV